MLPAHVRDPVTSVSHDPKITSLSAAFNLQDNFWGFLNQSGNELRLRRFGPAMIGMHELQPIDNILTGV
jgi:hypothetical protein